MKFTFEFSDSDFEGKGWERPLTTFWFTVNPPFYYDSDEYYAWEDDQLLEQSQELEEEYGVHDFYGGSDDTDVQIGYGSYEVTQDKWEELIQKWHDWFIDQGFEPGEINVQEVQKNLEL